MDSHVHPKLIEESLDGVAHTATALAEDHNWSLGCQICHPLHFQINEQETNANDLASYFNYKLARSLKTDRAGEKQMM
jgi:hypothetical protein